ncbi:glycosyltransferase [Polaromonas sp. CG_23.6]|uniref:glycosyltransferase family 4 protein n=1 Tax=Polaromonas sp. CG_23.6 TaxID=2760709 RepID=UPI0024746ABB|nr:glycosyltransferase [Polaromonas sp. CG_23.6]MDH6185992.1 glycosyltransferase involved in cell wall biosynthesis [Polaromonas sp. CG_23.6]
MKPIILTFTAFYLPGYRGGGPIRTIANMVERLGDDFDFRIVTTDRDLGDNNAYPNVKVDAWNTLGNGSVFYASNAMRSFLGLAKLMRETPHDLLYLNSFFDPRFTLWPVFLRLLGLAPKRPLILAPRGEFSAGALNIKSWKKKPFVQFARICNLFSNVTWHASTAEEATNIRRIFPQKDGRVHIACNIAVAGDLLQNADSALPDFETKERGSLDWTLRMCFLSRIAAMKNLDYALEVLAHVKSTIDFKIYGPKEDPVYWHRCHILIERLPSNIKVSYCGCVDHDDVKKIIGANDIFFVPSRGENFGHVFMESLSVGVPILVSDQTPWRNLESKGLGWDIPLNRPERFADAIEKAYQLSSKDWLRMKVNCIDFARKKADDPMAVELNRKLFLNVLALAH